MDPDSVFVVLAYQPNPIHGGLQINVCKTPGAAIAAFSDGFGSPLPFPCDEKANGFEVGGVAALSPSYLGHSATFSPSFGHLLLWPAIW